MWLVQVRFYKFLFTLYKELTVGPVIVRCAIGRFLFHSPSMSEETMAAFHSPESQKVTLQELTKCDSLFWNQTKLPQWCSICVCMLLYSQSQTTVLCSTASVTWEKSLSAGIRLITASWLGTDSGGPAVTRKLRERWEYYGHIRIHHFRASLPYFMNDSLSIVQGIKYSFKL